MDQIGCQVDFLAWGGEGRVSRELASRGIQAHVFPLQWNRPPHLKLLKLWQLARFIKLEIKPDFLLPYIGFNCKIIGSIWRLAGARYTWWNQRDEGREVYGSIMERHVVNSVPDVVSNSLEGRDFLVRKFGLSPDIIHIINNGIVLPTRSNRQIWRDRLGLGDGDILITMVANLTRFKDQATLLRAFAELHIVRHQSNIHLLLAGRLDEAAQGLKALSFDLGLCGRVHFAGEVECISDCYAATDIAVHSSVTEGCPNAVLEAMAHHLPVCGTDISGLRQALGVDKDSEWLAVAGDAEALAEIILRLVQAPEMRRSLGDRNRRRIEEHFSPAGLTDNVLSLIWNHVNQ